MRLTIYANPGAKRAHVETIVPNHSYRIHIDAPAKEEAANRRLIEILSKYFSVAKSRITIVRGHKHRIKHIHIAK